MPQCQQIHDYERGYADYWRFTPFSMDRLFENNGFTVLYRETTSGFSESQYIVYIASRSPERWAGRFPELSPADRYLTAKNDGSAMTRYSSLIRIADGIVRRLTRRLRVLTGL